MLSHLEALSTLPGVSGDEGAVRGYILEHCNPHACTVDAMGNVIVFKQGRRTSDKTILFAAHMDEVGFIVTAITDEGYLKFATVGGIDRRVILGKRVAVGPDRIPGIIGLKPVHLTTPDERKRVPEVADLYIDIGVSDAETAGHLIHLGDTAVFATTAFRMGNHLAARAIDNRVGCAVMLALMEEDLPFDAHFVFTVQEEIGLRGAMPAAFRIQPDIAIILEGTTAADLPGVTPDKQVCRVGKGVVIPFMDHGTVYDRTLYAQITALADRLGIPWQTKNVIAGGTDGASFQRAAGGAGVAALAAPVRNLHTGYNVANVEDMNHLLTLAREVLGALG
ncbi:MAG: M42 family peptidase [Oscillospiraceae bacterium]|nr:M42 family peptidase [Oscillospiraceae bacterium]